MRFAEVNRDLFSLPDRFYLAHCISSDCALGAGIAVTFEKNFQLREKLKAMPKEKLEFPTCIRIGKVYNLITKRNCWNKPTLESLTNALCVMRDDMIANNIYYFATYELGCHLDKLSWGNVEYVIKNVFKDTDINILICRI